MVAGVDVLAFRPDDELRKLAALAIDLQVDDVLVSGDAADAVFTTLGGSENGQTWLKAYDAAKDPWFNYFSEYGFTHDQDTWLSNPEIPLSGIARYTTKLRAGEDISRTTGRLRAERDEIVDEYRALLTDEEAAQFDELLGLARKVFPYIEEHNIYVEHWTHTVFWEKAWELADFLVAAGFTEQREDFFYLNRFEVDQVLFDVVESWAIGVPARGKKRWASEVRRRRGIMAALHGEPPAPAYGPAPEQVTDPFAIMNYGVTTERIQAWLGQGETASDSISGIPG